jgi:hypothetical protein
MGGLYHGNPSAIHIPDDERRFPASVTFLDDHEPQAPSGEVDDAIQIVSWQGTM